MRFSHALALLLMFSACSDADGGGGASSTAIVLRSSTLAGGHVSAASLRPQGGPAASVEGTAAGPCRVSIDGPHSVEGFCTTPLRVRGTANEISVSGPSHAPTRLLGGGDHGIEGIFGYRKFDLAAGSKLGGEDNVADVETEFNELKVHWNHIETTFEAAGRVFTVRHVVFSEPIFDEAAFEGCIGDPGERARFEKAGRLFPSIAAKRGDVLVCVKDTAADVCADADFAWIDRTTSAFVKARPSNPARLEGAFFTSKPSCRAGKEPREADFTMPVFQLRAKITTPFWLSSKFVDGGKRLYRYRDASGSKSGSTLTLTFDFDMGRSLFWESDPTKVDEKALAEHIGRAMLVPLRAANGRAQETDGDIGQGVSVTVSAVLQ